MEVRMAASVPHLNKIFFPKTQGQGLYLPDIATGAGIPGTITGHGKYLAFAVSGMVVARHKLFQYGLSLNFVGR